MIEIVTKYRTRDDILFDSKAVAIRHEAELDAARWYGKDPIVTSYNETVDWEDVNEWLRRNRARVLMMLGVVE